MKFALGVLAGGGLVFLYYRFANQAYDLGKQLMEKANNDYIAARNHIFQFGSEALKMGQELISRTKSIPTAWIHIRNYPK